MGPRAATMTNPPCSWLCEAVCFEDVCAILHTLYDIVIPNHHLYVVVNFKCTMRFQLGSKNGLRHYLRRPPVQPAAERFSLCRIANLHRIEDRLAMAGSVTAWIQALRMYSNDNVGTGWSWSRLRQVDSLAERRAYAQLSMKQP